MAHRSWITACAGATAAVLVGCANGPAPSAPSASRADVTSRAATGAIALQGGSAPEYERAYYNGEIVTMNHIELPQNQGVLDHAAADLYAVIYPANHDLWPSPPLCNPCVHNGNAIFHDHVLDSIPADPGHGEFNPLWHVFVIRPANATPATQAAFAARLPMTSEEAVDAAIDAGVAIEVDTNSYFMCAIVNEHAGR